MNKARREKLRVIAEKITNLRGEIEEVRDEEQAAFDNMPEAFQISSTSEASIEMMDDAINDLEVVETALQGAQE